MERINQNKRRKPKRPAHFTWVRATVFWGLASLLLALPGCKLMGGVPWQFYKQVRPVSDTHRLLRNAAYLKQSGRPELAVKELEEAHAREPQNLEVLDALIQCYETLGDFDRAQELYAEAEARGLSHPALENNRCYSWFLAGRFDQAEACFRKLLARQPDNQTVRNNLGLVLCRTGREAEALELWRQSLDEAGARQRLEQALAVLGLGVPPALAQRPAPPGAPALAVPSPPSQSPTAAAPEVKDPGSPAKAAEPRPAPAPAFAPVPATPPALSNPQTKSPETLGTATTPSRETAPLMTSPPSPPRRETVREDSRPTPSSQVKTAPGPTPPPASEFQAQNLKVSQAASQTQAVGTLKPPPQELRDTRIELKNGNGVKNYARKWRSRLKDEGFTVVDIGNHMDFGLETTTIAYRPEAAWVARELARKFFPEARLSEGGKISPTADIRVSLGHDRLQVKAPTAAAASPSLPGASPEAIAPVSMAPAAGSGKSPSPRPAAPSAAHPPAYLTLPELVETRIEIRNGNGVQNQAREWRSRLSAEGFSVVDIGNHIDFGLEKTTIAYRPEAARVAQTLARKFFPQAKLQEDGKVSPRADIRLSLGHDLIPRLQEISQVLVP